MKSPVATIRRQDGPRVALRAMQEHGISSIFVVERGQRLVGAVMADAALEAVEKGQKTLEGIMETDVPTVHPDTLISDILPRVATTALPFAVVDGEGRLLGLLVRGAVLAGLARKGVEAKHVG